MAAPDQTEKACKRCTSVLPTTSFGPNKGKADGLSTWCSCCTKLYLAEYHAARKGERSAKGKQERAVAREARRRTLAERASKACTRCGVVKPLELFHSSRSTVDGRMPHCSECHRDGVRRRKAAKVYEPRTYKTCVDKYCPRCSTTKPSSLFSKNRSTSTGLSTWCTDCVSVDRRVRYVLYKHKICTANKEYYVANRERVLARNKKYTADNYARMLAYQREWRAANPDKVKRMSARRAATEGYKDKRRAWVDNNRHLHRASRARCRAARRQRTPAWLSEQHLRAIQQIYKECPAGYHVDHVVPLLGKTVSGLHVPWNLQHLPADENLRKRNSFVSEAVCLQ